MKKRKRLPFKMWMASIAFGALLFNANSTKSQCWDSDNYSSAGTWTIAGTVGTTISVNTPTAGVLTFATNDCKNGAGGTGPFPDRAFRALAGTLGNAWSTDVDFNPTAVSATGPGHLLLSLTSSSIEPQLMSTNVNQDGVFLFFVSAIGAGTAGPWLIKGFSKDGTTLGGLTSGINICVPTNPGGGGNCTFGRTYYLRLERIDSEMGRVSVFSDPGRSVHYPGSPQCFDIAPTVSGLSWIQHGANYTGNAGRTISGTLDNLCINQYVEPTIGNINGEDELCANSTGDVYSINYLSGALYTWSVPTGMTITSGQGTSNIMVNAGQTIGSGNVTVTISFPSETPSCRSDIVVTKPISIEDCCFASQDLFKVWPDPVSLIPQSFEGKYYVKDNVTLVAGGDVEIDLTNVDIVFGKCSRILFEGNATLRANNSVFRTCSENDSWTGFQFRENSKAIINECTFKNAVRALDFESEEDVNSDARITNNLFSNNQMGIWVYNTIFGESITGNTFMIDDTEVDYYPEEGNCTNILSPTDYHAISISNTEMLGLIAQNDFISATDSNFQKIYWGIRSYASSGTISNNNFTNMYRSVDFAESANIHIENNKMELTRNWDLPQHQIAITSNSNNIWISGNELFNSNEYSEVPISNTAIYVEDGDFVNVQENSINGFVTGVQAMKLSNAHIGENDINNSNFYGIYVEDGLLVDVACNRINLHQNATSVGIAYFHTMENEPNISIKSNCIMECETAMYLDATVYDCAFPLPAIKNNYLYNYSTYGIRTIGFVGSIGTGPTWASAGKNTLISNNVPNYNSDVSATCPITISGNFGVITTAGPVTVMNPNAFHSTASCGHQIGLNVNAELGQDELCDLFLQGSQVLLRKSRGAYTLSSDFIGFFQQLETLEQRKQLNAHLTFMADEAPENLNAFYQQLIDAQILKGNELVWFQYHKLFVDGDYLAAQQVLAAIHTEDEEELNLLFIEQLHLKVLTGVASSNSIPTSSTDRLKSIATGNGRYADRGQVLLTLLEKEGDYAFKIVKSPKGIQKELTSSRLLNNYLNMYPNPAYETITVNFNVTEGSNNELVIYDVRGLIVDQIQLNASSNIVELDIVDYAPGIYLVELRNESGHVENQKFVKH